MTTRVVIQGDTSASGSLVSALGGLDLIATARTLHVDFPLVEVRKPMFEGLMKRGAIALNEITAKHTVMQANAEKTSYYRFKPL